MAAPARPVVTYTRKRKPEEESAAATWREIAPPAAADGSQLDVASLPKPKALAKKEAPKPGQSSILSFVGKSGPDPFDFAQSAKAKAASSSSTKEAKQLFLDFGQRNLASQVCSECNLTYSPGVAEDEALHAKFHKEHAQAVAFPGWKNETVVRSFIADGARIVRVSAEQSQGAYKKKIADLHAFVNRELAYSELPADAEAAAHRRITYLYVVNKKVQGCLIAEPIDRAFPVLNARRAAGDSQPDEAAGSPKKKLSRPESPLRCSTTSQPAQLGVSRIWVANGQRRKGIGSRLLEAARSSMFYGALVDAKRVAFSQPTSDGRSLASHCLGTDFLVY